MRTKEAVRIECTIFQPPTLSIRRAKNEKARAGMQPQNGADLNSRTKTALNALRHVFARPPLPTLSLIVYHTCASCADDGRSSSRVAVGDTRSKVDDS